MSATATAPIAPCRDEYPVFGHSIYLNSCSLGALSRRARARVNEYLDLWERRGAAAWYDVWWGALEDLRTRYGRLIGAGSGELALHANISGALGAVGEALDYGRRNRVVVADLDFPTIAYQWLAKRPRGVEVTIVESRDGVTVPLEAWERAIDDRTALVATSHVFFATGAIQDVGSVAELAHRHGALCLVDGYQAAGQIPVDVKALDVDFYCGGGLKWLMGGSGIAYVYAAPRVIPELLPRTPGWFAHRDQFRFDTRHLELHADARRLETGTPAMGSVYAQLGGLEILEQLGVPAVRQRTSELAEDLIESARALGLRPHVAATPVERSGIVMLPSSDPHRDVARLAEAGIVTDARPRHVRVSPYFYNVPDDHRALLERLTRG